MSHNVDDFQLGRMSQELKACTVAVRGLTEKMETLDSEIDTLNRTLATQKGFWKGAVAFSTILSCAVAAFVFFQVT